MIFITIEFFTFRPNTSRKVRLRTVFAIELGIYPKGVKILVLRYDNNKKLARILSNFTAIHCSIYGLQHNEKEKRKRLKQGRNYISLAVSDAIVEKKKKPFDAISNAFVCIFYLKKTFKGNLELIFFYIFEFVVP